MILILSEQNEMSTDNTIEWLLAKNISIVRFNTETPWQLKKIEQSTQGLNCKWSYKGDTINSKAIKVVWCMSNCITQFFTFSIYKKLSENFSMKYFGGAFHFVAFHKK